MTHAFLTRNSRLLLLAVVVSGLLCACTSATGSRAMAPAAVSERVASARSADDHRALVQYFSAEADAAQKKADEHKNLTQIYSPGYGAGYHVQMRPSLDPSRHCKALVKLYERAAEENRAMARIHEELAVQAGQAK